MAKLNKDKAEEAKNSSSGFDLIPDGVYHAILKDVDATRSGPKGPYWSWEFDLIGTADGSGATEVEIENPNYDPEKEGSEPTKMLKLVGRKQWNNTSMKAMWSFEQTYSAFGSDDLEQDTDEFLGLPVKLVIGSRTIPLDAPNRAGEVVNQVNRVQPPDLEDPVVVAHLKSKKDAKEMADLF